ncbi:MAG: response regulator transcription factor [Pseudomonadota bacterium]
MALDSRSYFITLDNDAMMSSLLERAIGKKSIYFSSAKDLEAQMVELDPIAVFVDVQLGSYENGLDIIPKLKERWPFSPVIVVTGDRQDDAVSNALSKGADDFIFKPVNPKEVVARMQTRMADLAKRQTEEVHTIGDLIVDRAHRSILNSNKQQRFLSPTEMGLLNCLLSAQGTVVPREVMKRRCWGQIFVSDNALNRKLHEVRRIIKDLSTQVNIRTLYGTGFMIEVTPLGGEVTPDEFQKSA